MLYAAYGSNLHPTRLRERVPSASLLGAAPVRSRALRFHKQSKDGSGKCDIAVSTEEIYVAVYRIDPTQKPNLDRAEGLGAGYEIDTIKVPEFGQCFTYVAADTHIDENLKPFSWYKELVIVGCEHLRFPTHYVQKITAVESLEDANRERHNHHMRIVHRAKNGT